MRMLLKSLRWLTATSLVALSAQSVLAAPVYYAYSYTGSGVASAGIFTVDGVLNAGTYGITAVQGSRNASSISGLLPAGAFGSNDNRLYLASPFVDTAGFSFTAGAQNFNVGNAAAACGSASLYGETVTGLCDGLQGVSLSISAFTPVAGSSYFSYAYTGNGVASAGILTASGAAGGPYTVTSILGQRNGVDITGLLAAGVFGSNDNLLDPNEPYVDGAGFSFTAGGSLFNLGNARSACGTTSFYGETPTGVCAGLVEVAMNVTQLQLSVPEPGGLLLAGVALAAAAAARRRKS